MKTIKEFERNVINCSTGEEIIETYLLKEEVKKLIDEIYTDNKVGLAILRELKSKIEGR